MSDYHVHDVSHTTLRGLTVAEIVLISAPPLALVLVCVICSLKSRRDARRRRERLEERMDNAANEAEYVPGEDWYVVLLAALYHHATPPPA